MTQTDAFLIQRIAGGDKTALKLDKVSEGLWRTTFDVKVPGLYKFESGELAAVTHAGIEDAREMSEVVATEAKLRPIADATGGGLFWTRGAGLLASTSSTAVDVPRVTMLASARHLAGSGWLGLKDREAFVTRGVKLTPMFTGLIALSALIFLIALAWWREGR